MNQIKQQNINSGQEEIKDINLISRSFINQGKIHLKEKNLQEAFNCFKKADYKIGCAYCFFINNELEKAVEILKKIKYESPYSNWLLKLIYIMENKTIEEPTYFQIRNFYEQDLEMLFYYDKTNRAKSLVNKYTYFRKYNLEIYKYNARVLMEYGYYNESEVLLKKGMDVYYKDSELHFIIGDLYLKQDRIEEAKESYKKSIEVNGEYYPATKKLNYLNN